MQLFQLENVDMKFVRIYLTRILYHGNDLRMIILSVGKQHKIKDIYSYRSLKINVILSAFKLGRKQLCPVKHSPVAEIPVRIYLDLNIHKSVIQRHVQIKPAEFSVGIFGGKLSIFETDTCYAVRRYVKQPRNKIKQEVGILGKYLFEYYIKFCGNNISSHNRHNLSYTYYITFFSIPQYSIIIYTKYNISIYFRVYTNQPIFRY